MQSRLSKSLVALLCSITLGVRTKRAEQQSTSKFVAGVPILNYHLVASQDAVEEVGKQRWLVMAREGIKGNALHKMCASKGVDCVSEGHPDQGGVGYFLVRCTLKKLKALVKKHGKKMIKFVEPERKMRLDPDEMKPSRRAQEDDLWGLEKVGALPRVDGSPTGKGTHVYVMDTGLRFTHSDYGGRASSAIDVSSGSVVECNGSPNCALDVQGHGTHCAGTAAGSTYGVAPEAKIYAVKTLGDTGEGSFEWNIFSYDWLMVNAPKPAVVSASLGSTSPFKSEANAQAIKEATETGIVVIVAGGNSQANSCEYTPAFAERAITVGSTDRRDFKSGFSNYGPCTEIWAPGSDILSASSDGDDASVVYSGTSMACPHVSGAALLLLQQGVADGFTADEGELATDKVLEALVDRSAKDVVKRLFNEDNNRLLWVGAGDAQDGDAQPVGPIPEEPDACLECATSWYYCWIDPRCQACAVCTR